MLADWNNFLRPRIWLFVIAVWLVAFLAADAQLSFEYLLLVPVFVMVCSASITFNHYCDYESDRKSRQLHRFPVASGAIGRRSALLASIMLMAAPLFLAYLFLSMAVFYMLLFSGFMILAYSARPFRIKEKPFIETFWNGIGYGTLPYYISLLASEKPMAINLHFLGLILFFVAASGHILLQVRDVRDDVKARVTTTSTMLGRKRMIRLSRIFILAAGLVVVYLAAGGFLNYFAWLSLAAGAFIFLEHRRMKRVEKSYGRLQLFYVLGGLSFFLALL